MAAPEQEPQRGAEGGEIAKLFQNVGNGLLLISQYVQQAAPQSKPLADQLMQGYEQLVQQVVQARQGGGGGQAPGPAPQEAGAADVRPV